mmetsp:Transcript_13126/g.41376  ORF Transcript_13126/g.41376 Transcript_13126/m.41376 type:complete len:203 (-) Transcript_13126:382-990(-)
MTVVTTARAQVTATASMPHRRPTTAVTDRRSPTNEPTSRCSTLRDALQPAEPGKEPQLHAAGDDEGNGEKGKGRVLTVALLVLAGHVDVGPPQADKDTKRHEDGGNGRQPLHHHVHRLTRLSHLQVDTSQVGVVQSIQRVLRDDKAARHGHDVVVHVEEVLRKVRLDLEHLLEHLTLLPHGRLQGARLAPSVGNAAEQLALL